MKAGNSTTGGTVAGAARDAAQMLETACRIHTDFTVGRYLMANAEGRWNGAEKALRHRELCSFYVAFFHGHSDPEKAARQEGGSYAAVHTATQKLTDHLDEVIGFPLKGQPDYDKLAAAFFERFHALAMEALVSHQCAKVAA
jgi:hypothetical protein